MDKKIRVLLAKPGLDGHDVGVKVVARALVDAGMEVIYTGLHQRTEQIVAAAVQEDVDFLGLSILSGAHISICQNLIGLLQKQAKEITIIVGGIIPEEDRARLKEMGVAAVFPTATRLDEIVAFIQSRPHEGAAKDRKSDQTGTSSAKGKKTQEEEELKEVVLESGIKVKPVYTQEDVRAISYAEDIGSPGSFPFTRGIHPLMYRKKVWTMRQYSGFATAAETNKRFKFLMQHGQTGLNVAFDLPTQMGLDSDDPCAQGEVGRVGMAVDTLEDFEEAFAGIPLDKISTSLTINSVAAIMLAMYAVVAEKQGIPREKASGTAQNDILKEYIGRGTWIFPVAPSLKLIADTVEYCSRHMPKYYPLSVCGYHIRESGATPVQEIAYAFAIAKAYIDEVRKRGLGVDEFVPRISFNFDIHGNLFEQIAKFRAARRLWARIIRDEYAAKDERSMQLKMIAGGGGGGLTIEEPENNIVRGAYYALISALSGTQTMALCSYDEAYTIPTEKAALISLRTMQILADEMGLRDTVDPLAGSYYVENLTSEMEKKIVDIMRDVDNAGGIVEAIATGYIQNEVSKQAYRKEKQLQSGEIVKVGANKYKTEMAEEKEQRKIELHRYDPAQAEVQLAKLRKIKARRDNAKVEATMNALRRSAERNENLMPALIEAVKAYATVGEMRKTLQAVYGSFKEPVRL
jgi:methylmalonyl-CoA mutase N-terminal domain/subunit